VHGFEVAEVHVLGVVGGVDLRVVVMELLVGRAVLEQRLVFAALALLEHELPLVLDARLLGGLQFVDHEQVARLELLLPLHRLLRVQEIL